MKNVAWFEKYRPETIDEMIFESEEQHQLCKALLEKFENNVLLYGPPGTGKTTFARILIKNYIKHEHDLFRCTERSVAEIDRLIKWLPALPFKSPFKIAYLEEMDKLSHQAQTTLKDGALERYQTTVRFIGTTNWIQKLDTALVSRFMQIEFTGKYDKSQLLNFIQRILDIESAQYDKTQLEEFVNNLPHKVDLRTLLSQLQAVYLQNDKQIDFNKLNVKTQLEDEIVELTLSIINTLQNASYQDRVGAMLNPTGTIIAKQYVELIAKLIPTLQYETIFHELYSRVQLLPIKIIIGEAINDIPRKVHLDIHFLGTLYKVFRCLASLTV